MMAAFVLMGGKLADIIGMKKTFLTGALFYIVGSLLASVRESDDLYSGVVCYSGIWGRP